MRPRILAEGEAELLQAALWYEDRREGLGMQFYECLLDTCEAIGKNPARFPSTKVLRLQEMFVELW